MNMLKTCVIKLWKIVLFLSCFLFCINIAAQQRTYYYKGTKAYDKNGVQQTNSSEYYVTFTNNVAYISDANGNSKGGVTMRFRGRTSDGNLWYCHAMEQPNISYLPGTGVSSYNTIQWTPNIGGEYIVSPDYSILNYRSAGYTFVMVRSTPSSNTGNRNEPTLRR